MKTSDEDEDGDGIRISIVERTTLCSYCRPMASTSFTQLHNRKRTMAAAPDVEPYRCTKCGSIAWATTTEMIDLDKPGPVIADHEPTIMWWLLGASSLTILIALLVVWFAR